MPNLTTLKHEPHSSGFGHHHSHHHHSHHHHSSQLHNHHQSQRNSDLSSSSQNANSDRSSVNSPILQSQDDINRPVAVVHGKKNRLAYGNEDEFVTKRFCLSNERESNNERGFLLSGTLSRNSEDECNDECANDIRCQHRHSSSVPDLRTTNAIGSGQTHSTASSPSSSTTTFTPTSSVLSQILASQLLVASTSPTPQEIVSPLNMGLKVSSKFQYVLGAATSMAMKVHEETMTYLNQGFSFEIKTV